MLLQENSIGSLRLCNDDSFVITVAWWIDISLSLTTIRTILQMKVYSYNISCQIITVTCNVMEENKFVHFISVNISVYLFNS